MRTHSACVRVKAPGQCRDNTPAYLTTQGTSALSHFQIPFSFWELTREFTIEGGSSLGLDEPY